MEHAQKFSNLIYDYFVIRIRFCYYNYGDNLPSIESMCREFCVSDKAVKAALKRMSNEGYTSMSKGKLTKVTYQQTEQERNEYIQQFFSLRWRAIHDLYESDELIFIPLLTEGARRMEDSDFNYLSDLAERSAADDIIRFYYFVLQKLENPLAINLLWETSIFQGFPFPKENSAAALYGQRLIRNKLKKIISDTRNQNWSDVFDDFLEFQRMIVEKQIQYFEKQNYPIEKEKQIPFDWRIYRERPQVCYSLAIRILHQNCQGEFRDKPFLPSYEKMAHIYGVSISTMRRTVSILNQMGAAQSINGKGTLIFSPLEYGNNPDFSSPAMRRNLAFYIQALELLNNTCMWAVRPTLEHQSAMGKNQLIHQLEEYLFSQHCDLTLEYLLFYIADNSPLSGIQDIYGKLYGLLLWGYPLKAVHKDSQDYNQRREAFTKIILACLRENDISEIILTLKGHIDWELTTATTYLLSVGFQPEELRSAPGIMLLLND